MEQIKLGRTGEKIPVIGMGTWKLGVDVEKEVEALRQGFKEGMNFVDTAEMYHTEDIVKKSLAGQKDIFVATKISPDHFRHDEVIKACNASLKALGVKTIDLYQLHWPNPRVPIKETMRAMEELVEQGKIRYIGVSNFSVEETGEAQEALKQNKIVSNQVEYSILVRGVEDGLAGYCKKEGITIIAYSPLARGLLYNKKNAKLLELLESIGEKYGRTATQVALNWLISKGGVTAIPKASSREHVIENAGSSSFRLSKEDLSTLNHFL